MSLPPFCPYPSCRNHMKPQTHAWFRPYGFHQTKAFGLVPRFRCLDCGRTFSTQTFSIDYYAKRIVDYHDLAGRHSGSMSLRGTARTIKASCGTVQNRLERLDRQIIALQADLRSKAAPTESICIDGFVSFDGSQFFPIEIPIAISSDTQFVFDLSHASRRRSGRMTPSQKEKAKKLYAEIPIEKGGIQRGFRDILDSLSRCHPPLPGQPLSLITDEKLEYVRELHAHQLYLNRDADHRIEHRQVSSKAPRTRGNPLFSSNYIDREIRKDQANHHRETVCFSRNVANGMARLSLYLFLHNYQKKFRIKDPVMADEVHAEKAGLPRQLIREGLRAAFKKRVFLSRISLTSTLERIWKKDFVTPGLKTQRRPPAFAFG